MTDLDHIERQALPHVIMTGNPVDGFHLIGPFDNFAEGLSYAEKEDRHLTADWWLVPVHPA